MIGRLALGAVFILFTASLAGAEPIDLTGRWLGIGYTCGASGEGWRVYDERVEVAFSDDALIAVKIDGDPCIGPGEVTWRALTPGAAFEVGAVIPVESHVAGLPARYDGVLPGEIEVIGPDRLLWRVAPADSQPIIFERLPEPLS